MTEYVEYSVIKVEEKFEVRQYPAMVLAAVEGREEYEAFGILFDYISGNNRARRRIPMTAPVISGNTPGERIPMTAPVVSRRGLFAFVLPKDYNADDAPTPLDPRARLMPMPAKKLAVLRFRGRATDRVIRARTAELSSWVGRSGLEPAGEPYLMRYNPPFTPGFLRRNEVAVEVKD